MDLLDRLLGHDAWTTRQLLEICDNLPDETLDRDFDIGHRTLRRTLHHIISNMEIWSSLMANTDDIQATEDQTVAGMMRRLAAASRAFPKAISIVSCKIAGVSCGSGPATASIVTTVTR